MHLRMWLVAWDEGVEERSEDIKCSDFLGSTVKEHYLCALGAEDHVLRTTLED